MLVCVILLIYECLFSPADLTQTDKKKRLLSPLDLLMLYFLLSFSFK